VSPISRFAPSSAPAAPCSLRAAPGLELLNEARGSASRQAASPPEARRSPLHSLASALPAQTACSTALGLLTSRSAGRAFGDAPTSSVEHPFVALALLAPQSRLQAARDDSSAAPACRDADDPRTIGAAYFQLARPTARPTVLARNYADALTAPRTRSSPTSGKRRAASPTTSARSTSSSAHREGDRALKEAFGSRSRPARPMRTWHSRRSRRSICARAVSSS